MQPLSVQNPSLRSGVSATPVLSSVTTMTFAMRASIGAGRRTGALILRTTPAILVMLGICSGFVGAGHAQVSLGMPAATATPVISPGAGVYSGPQTVSITDTTAGAKIYYTLNGSLPTANSAQYSGSITVSASETVVAMAIAPGDLQSSTAVAQYILQGLPTSFIYSIAGNGHFGYSGDGGAATLAQVNGVSKAIVDSAGNLYIADKANNRVRKVAAGTGAITTYAGNGTAGYSGDNGPAVSAEVTPAGLALDSAGNLYIADANNNVVREVASATGTITTIAGNGTAGYGGDNGAAKSAELSQPSAIAVDSAGNLYVADSGNGRVRKIAAPGGIITTYAGNGSIGYGGNGGVAINAALDNPSGLSLDGSGNLYIADTYNNVIRKVTAINGVISTVAGNGFGAGHFFGGYTGDGGPATSAELYRPEDVAVDNVGNVYIADSYNHVIRKVTASNGTINTIAGNGSTCNAVSGDGGPATSAGLCYPPGVSVDGAGNLYIADNYQRVREVTVAGIPPSAVTPSPVFSLPGGTYATPESVTITDTTPGASIYMTMDGTTPNGASEGNYGPINVSGTVTISAIAIAPGNLQSAAATEVYTITAPPNSVMSTVAGSGINGSLGAGSSATSAEIGVPKGVALDGGGNLYFTDSSNNLVWMVSAGTGVISIAAGNGSPGYTGDGHLATSAELNNPSGLASDKAGNLYIADTNNLVVRRVDAGTRVITTYAGNGHLGYGGDQGAATAAELSNPDGVALDGAGNVYVADAGNGVVRKILASTGVISTFAGNGIQGYSGDGGLATSAGFGYINGIAFDGANNLYIADGSGRIREVEASNGTITTVAGNGDWGYSGDGGPATSAEIADEDVAVDSNGNIYISDGGEVVREVSGSPAEITTVAGNGFFGYYGDGLSATVGEINGPLGLGFDGMGNLYIADSGNYRIREVTFHGPAASPVFSLASGNYVGARTVSITDSTPGAVIYYTTDGTPPTIGSAKYSSSITVSGTETLEAIATASGHAQSAVQIATYTITPLSLYPLGNLEAAVDNSTGGTTVFQADLLRVSGWVVDTTDGAPLSNVRVYIDGNLLGTPTLGVARPDVAAFFGNTAFTNSGYQFYYSAATFSAGTHAITVVATDSGGRASTFGPVTITVSSAPPPFGSLELAVDSATGSKTVSQTDSVLVAGWVADAADGAPLSNVKVYIDGNLVGVPTLGIARADVAAAYGNAAYTNSGYDLVRSAATLSGGTHSVTVVATDSGGRSTTFGPLTITVSTAFPPFGNLEQAVDSVTGSKTVAQTDAILVSGWVADATDGAPLSNVKVYLDGNLAGTPTLGIARADVAAAYNNAAYTKSGYLFFYPATSLSAGTHAFTVVAIDSGGRSTTFGPLSITIAAAPSGPSPPFGNIEAAVDNSTGSTTVLQTDLLRVSGWVADVTDGAPVNNVKVFIDGNLLGAPTLGIARPDVAAAYGNSAYTNSGYAFYYSGGAIFAGTHAITVVAIDSGGRSTTFGPLSITVVQ
jgi:sugar lactone lactonase YvrE